MSCNCCNGKVKLTFQQGNNVLLELTYSDDDIVTNIEQGYDLICGIYDVHGNMVYSCKLSDNTDLKRIETGVYYLTLDHELTVAWLGEYTVELTLVDGSGNKIQVCHADELVTIVFEPRKNNNLINHE